MSERFDRDHLEREFPNLAREGYEVTSTATHRYNCVAWAVGDDQNWWEPSGKLRHYWPPGVPLEYSYASYVRALRTQGFEPCSDGALEPGYEKIAVYADAEQQLTHMARQLPDGQWTSKLGPWEDISHSTLTALDSPFYGSAIRFHKRRIAD